MKRRFRQPVIAIMLLSGGALLLPTGAMTQSAAIIELPQPVWDGPVSVEEALKYRRSVRSFRRDPLSLEEVSQLLWAAQGLKDSEFRTAPSAGALYPLEVYAALWNIEGLEAGVYRYDPPTHSLRVIHMGHVRKSLSRAALGQDWVHGGAMALVLAAVYERTTKKYGERGIRYAHMEAGHAAQNVYLQAQALGLGTVVVGAFRDGSVRRVMHMQADEQPLSIMPIGKPLK